MSAGSNAPAALRPSNVLAKLLGQEKVTIATRPRLEAGAGDSASEELPFNVSKGSGSASEAHAESDEEEVEDESESSKLELMPHQKEAV